MCNRYNGWSNYPTWRIMLEINDNTYLYNSLLDYLEEELEYQSHTTLDSHIKDSVLSYGEMFSLVGFSGDLIQFALRLVQWNEITDSLLEDLKDE